MEHVVTFVDSMISMEMSLEYTLAKDIVTNLPNKKIQKKSVKSFIACWQNNEEERCHIH